MTLTKLKNKHVKKAEQREIFNLLAEARLIGRTAAMKQLKKLQKQGPKFRVKDGNKTVGEMLDVCGFAWITIPGKSKIVKAFKALGTRGINQEYIVGEMRISKAYQRGYNLNIGLGIGRQEMSVNEEAVWAASEFLNNAGLECNYGSRID